MSIDFQYKTCFQWNRLPIELDSVNIAFCTNNLNKTLMESQHFNGDVSQCFTEQKSQLFFQHILGTMPFTCFVDLDTDRSLSVLTKIQNNNENLNKMISPELNLSDDDRTTMIERLSKQISKKTCIFTFTKSSKEWNKQMFYTHMNFKYDGTTHRLFVGEMENIPKSVLNLCDYIFIEETNTLNQYLEQMNHSTRITFSDFSTYVIDKRNYINSVVFSYNDVTDKLHKTN